MGQRLRRYKNLIFLLLIGVFLFNLWGCGGKKVSKPIEKEKQKPVEEKIEKNINTDIISFSLLIANLDKKINNNIYYFSLKKEFQNKSKEYIIDLYSYYCQRNNGIFKLEDKSIEGDYINLILNGLLKENIPEVYINEYFKSNAIKLTQTDLANTMGLNEEPDFFCYFPDKKEFFFIKFNDSKSFYLYKNDIVSTLPLAVKNKLNKILSELKKKINKDLENVVWISLNLPLYYQGVKLFYFKAEPLNKLDLIHNEIWNVYIKLKNETSKPFILNLSNITLIKEGKEYKPLFHIDRNGKILDYQFSGACRYIGDNKIIIEPEGVCEIFFVKEGELGGLRFINVKDLKGAILVVDKYPIYIWKMSKYDMKIKNLTEGVK
jgi:hypothetical protein